MEEGRHNSPSNAQFDIDLKARNPAWGIRDLSLIKKIAEMNGLTLEKQTRMPTNNLTLFFQKRDTLGWILWYSMPFSFFQVFKYDPAKHR